MAPQAEHRRHGVETGGKADAQLQQLPGAVASHRPLGALLGVPLHAARNRRLAQERVGLAARLGDGHHLHCGTCRGDVDGQGQLHGIVHAGIEARAVCDTASDSQDGLRVFPGRLGILWS